MRAVMLMFDSLNKKMLPNYAEGFENLTNFTRLGEKCVAFDNCYVGSLPCMPARRELHTGRYNFLHRGWGPLEPYDDSVFEILKNNGVYTHLTTDHYHYWEDGGATYHNRYNTYEFIRGQEGDKWQAQVKDEPLKEYATEPFSIQIPLMKQDAKNIKHMKTEEDSCLYKTVQNGVEFIDNNHNEDNWLLQIECFDPHEPFFVTDKYKEDYPKLKDGLDVYWPRYDHVKESEEVVEHGKCEYQALMKMCDAYVGKVLDKFDEFNLWEDTMLIVNTDHGYLLGEHDWWSKSVMPVYNEIANIPLFIYDPRNKKCMGQHRQALTQSIDIAPTILDFFGMEKTKDMDGIALKPVIESDQKIREYALFGFHEGHVNITDGKYKMMRAPVSIENKPLKEHTLMPCNMRNMFNVGTLKKLEMSRAFKFTKGIPLVKVDTGFAMCNPFNFGNKLFDIENDPNENNEIEDLNVELKLMNALIKLMDDNDAPDDQYERLGLVKGETLELESLKKLNERQQKIEIKGFEEFKFKGNSKNQLYTLLSFIPLEQREYVMTQIIKTLADNKMYIVNSDFILAITKTIIPKNAIEMVLYFVIIAGRNY